MPSSSEVDRYLSWYKKTLVDKFGRKSSNLSILRPTKKLCFEDHEAIQSNANSHLWRFQPDGLVIERSNQSSSFRLHVLLATSHAVSLKDVGELGSYARILVSPTACLISPKGVSNEVRLVQAEETIRARLFSPGGKSQIFAGQWLDSASGVDSQTIIPIEFAELLRN